MEATVLDSIGERKDLCNMISSIYHMIEPYVDLDEKVLQLSIGRVLLTWEALAGKKINHILTLSSKERSENMGTIFEMIGDEVKEFNLCGEKELDFCLERAFLNFKSLERSPKINPCRH